MSLVLRGGPFQTGRRGRPPGPRGDSRSALLQGAPREQSRLSAVPYHPPPRSAVSAPRGPVPPVPSQQILVSIHLLIFINTSLTQSSPLCDHSKNYGMLLHHEFNPQVPCFNHTACRTHKICSRGTINLANHPIAFRKVSVNS